MIAKWNHALRRILGVPGTYHDEAREAKHQMVRSLAKSGVDDRRIAMAKAMYDRSVRRGERPAEARRRAESAALCCIDPWRKHEAAA